MHSAQLPAGWVAFDILFERLSLAQFVALGLGPRARVLAPEELRDLVSADLAAAAEQCSVPSQPGSTCN